MQQAVEKDMTAINTDGTYEYVDNEDAVIQQDDGEEQPQIQEENTSKEVSMNEI